MIPRLLSEKILQLATKFPVISITGPRQSGKTTLIKSLFSDYTYVNLEDPNIREAVLLSPLDFLQRHPNGLIIDEAQYAPTLFSYLQLVVDADPSKKGKYILSGSQNFLLMERITQSLAGRVAILQLLPFSLAELKGYQDKDKTAIEHIFDGFYPRLIDQSIEPIDFYPAYIQTYVERDARMLVNLSNLDTFSNFIRLCAGRVGTIFNQTEIGNLVGVDKKTAQKWLSILNTGYITFTLPPYFNNFDKRIVKSPKLYFWDTGLVCALLGIRSAADLVNHYARGAIFENFVIVEMLKQFLNKGIQPNAYFWSERNTNEVDLLLEEYGQRHIFEIKAGVQIKPDFFKGLTAFQQASGNDPSLSTVIYGGQTSFLHPNGINIRAWNDLPLLGSH